MKSNLGAGRSAKQDISPNEALQNEIIDVNISRLRSARSAALNDLAGAA